MDIALFHNMIPNLFLVAKNNLGDKNEEVTELTHDHTLFSFEHKYEPI